jgi:hypothetical protein
MSVELVLAILIFTNTIVIIATLAVIVFALVRMGIETARFAGIDDSFTELTSVVEQQSRLLQYMDRRSSGG